MSHLLFEYDSTYSPPAPVVEIIIEGRGKERDQVRQMALIDSGADGTMIPRNILRQVGGRFWESMRMRGVSGVSHEVDLYLVTIHVGNQPIKVSAIAMPNGSELIVGRDVLNQLKITLDGFSSYTTIETLFDD